jgi:hypothetical protein
MQAVSRNDETMLVLVSRNDETRNQNTQAQELPSKD